LKPLNVWPIASIWRLSFGQSGNRKVGKDMASISTDKKTGRRRILFVCPDGNRKSVRLGKMTKKQAESVKLFIEDLLAGKTSVVFLN